MLEHYKSTWNSALGEGCFVALLESRELLERAYTDHLSADERARYAGISNRKRKTAWLAGRLAAKYLFLSRLEMAHRVQSQGWKPSLSRLTSEALSAYSPWMYKKVEVLSSESADPHTRLVWCGGTRTESVSLSHKEGMSSACLSSGAATAIDMETRAPRVSAFYRTNFTKAERTWVASSAGEDTIRSNWLFTLLWTLKESALKLGWLNQAGVWDLPRIEIEGLPDVNYVAPYHFNSTLGDDFVLFHLRIRERFRVMQVRVAVTATRNLILTLMNPLNGVAN